MKFQLPADLAHWRDIIKKEAANYGLDFYETIFEVLDWKQMNEVASYGGFPNRYPHWRFGMEYEQLSKSYSYGLSKIYEMVINNDPCYAYLLHSNHLVDQKLVMAHVYGHCDFFKNNYYFLPTAKNMMDQMANHKVRVSRYIDKLGYEKVESFIDVCLSIDNLIDFQKPFQKEKRQVEEEEEEEEDVHRIRVDKEYLEEYINPDAFLDLQKERMKQEKKKKKKIPQEPTLDVMGFLRDHAPLTRWEYDVLHMIRTEAYYFAPQAQTKVMNEGWACVAGDTRIVTDKGLIPAKEIFEKKIPIRVFDGMSWQKITDWAHFPRRKTIKIRTRRGYVLEASNTHQIVARAQNKWCRLDQINIEDKIQFNVIPCLTAKQHVDICWVQPLRYTLEDVAEKACVNVSTVIRHRDQIFRSRSAAILDPLLAEYDQRFQQYGNIIKSRHPFKVPQHLDEDLAQFFGYLVGDGHISKIKRVLGLTTGDEEARDRFAFLGRKLFDLSPSIRKDQNRWRINFHNENLSHFLISLGLKHGVSARFKEIPEGIWRSPQSVIGAFLRAYFDCDGYAGKQGIILSTSSRKLGEGTQQLLLCMGILSRRRKTRDGWHVHITGPSAKTFAEKVGFGLNRKRQALAKFINDKKMWKREDAWDDVVAIEVGENNVYDFTVDKTHRYVAHGFINHNSYWHSKIMTSKILDDSEIIDFADHHSGTVSMTPGRLNPYKVGIELYRDIEERWNRGQFGKDYEECDDMVVKKKWDKKLGLGRDKIFEVRKVHNDVTFIDHFLTPEFCIRHKLFTFDYNNQSQYYEIVSREFAKVKQKLLFGLTNFGQPYIEVVDANYGNRGELYLRHRHEGIDLRLDYAREVLQNIHKIWKRPVVIETIVGNHFKIFAFDGKDHKEANSKEGM